MKQPGGSGAPHTNLCHYTTDSVYYGSDDLVCDLVGKTSFVDVFMKQTFGRTISEAERRIVDAVLVTLMEHGMTPSAIATRMIYSSSPENLQAGVAAGLLAVASRFVGTMEPAAQLLARIVAAGSQDDEARAIARDFRARREAVPGFGHHLHRPDDPRAIALLALAREAGTYGAHCAALERLAAQLDEAAGRHITINATGAIAALLGDIGIPAELMRGFAVLSRAAGLIAHIAEEQRDPSGRFIWKLVDEAMTLEPLAR
ncbi:MULTISPECIES: citryl-CoA lyase [unclassified Caballeronia]|uniref:citryl-CoA lyase n=1 Tax=unclassified Caballeronia TaxID=2646786 RepID=UPI001F1F39B0|nr:citryl-CoA lyase [Caballeronia sp. PC1]MCE4573458.1 citryl-CoA lyase [Caballeronia sp. CLC5]